MTRPTGLTAQQIQAGKVSRGTVDASALNPSTLGTDGLRAHVSDPSRAHMASSTGIVDAGNYYTGDEVEAALQEIGSAHTDSRLNGMLSGGRFDEVVAGLPTAGRLLTLESATTVLIGASVHNISGLDVTLPNVNDKYYIYLDTDSSSGNYLTLQYTTSGPPAIETSSGVEAVLFGLATVSGGVVAAFQDARFFVRNLDRKVQFSAVQGEDVDAWGEGCFATLDAAFFWLMQYGAAGSGEAKQATLLIRGLHEITSTLEFPGGNLILRGDGNAVLQQSSGSVVDLLLITTASGQLSNVAIEDLTFKCVEPATNALVIVGSNGLSNLRLERVQFQSTGADRFDCCVDASSFTGTLQGAVIRDCGGTFEDTALLFDAASACNEVLVDNCKWSGAATATSGVVLTNVGGVRILGGTITNASTGLLIDGTGVREASVKDTRFLDVDTGITARGVGNLTIDGAYVQTDAATGSIGIYVGSTVLGFSITNSSLKSGRTNDSGLYGIFVEPRSDAGGRIANCLISNFFDYTMPGNPCAGVCAAGTVTDSVVGMVVTDNTFVGCRLWATYTESTTFSNNVFADGGMSLPVMMQFEDSSNIALSGNVLDGGNQTDEGILISGCSDVTVEGSTLRALLGAGITVEESSTNFALCNNLLDGMLEAAYPSMTGILVHASGGGSLPSNGDISNNNVNRCAAGIVLQGVDEGQMLSFMAVHNNTISSCGAQQASQTTTFAGRGAKGIALEFCSGTAVEGNQILRLGEVLDNGTPLVWTQSVWPIGIYLRNSTSIDVLNNRIEAPQSFGSGVASGLWAEFRDIVGGGTFARHQYVGNRIHLSDDNFADDSCIRVTSVAGSGDPNSVSDMTMLGGFISSAAANPAVYGVVLDAGSDGGTIERVTLQGLQVAEGSTAGVAILSDGSSTVQGVSIQGAGIQSAATAVQVALSAEAASKFFIQNCILGGSISFVVADSAADLSAITITDCTIEPYATATDFTPISLLIDGRNVSGLRVSNNSVTALSGGGTLGYGVSLSHFGSNGWAGLQDVSVCDNRLVGGFTAVRIALDGSATATTNITNLSVDRNHVSGLQTDAGAYGPALQLYVDSDEQITVSGISISHNQVENALHLVHAVFEARDGSVTGLCTLHNLTFDYNSGAGINGISVTGPSTVGVDFDIANVSVCNNKIQNSVTGSTDATGIDVVFAQVDTAPYRVEGLSVSGNQITTASTSTGDVRGISIEMTCNYNNLVANQNSIRCVDVMRHGLRVFHRFTTSEATESSVVGVHVAGVANPASNVVFELTDSLSAVVDFRPVRWRGTSITNNNILAACVQATVFGFDQEAALAFLHCRSLPAPAYVLVASYGLTVSNNVLTGIGSGNAIYGFVSNQVGIVAAWPNGTPTINPDGNFLQEGWVFMGNTVTNFMSFDGSTYYGQCVRVTAPTPATELADGIVVGNVAQDSAAGPAGWEELSLSTMANNVLSFPRTT